jgi:hypothetical protein
VPAVQSNKPTTVKSKEIQAEKKQLQTRTTDVQPKKAALDKQTVQRIQSQHLNFKATPKTGIASVKFNPNYRIEAAQNWSGPQYEVFRSYQPQWHDQTWSARATAITSAYRWRLVLLDRRLLVSGVGLR